MARNVEELQVDRPANRGKFSPERDVWEAFHQERFSLWQAGHNIEEICEEFAVTATAVRRSIEIVKARLPRSEVTAAEHTHLRLRTIKELGPRFVSQLKELMSHPNPLVQIKALELFRKAVAMDQQQGTTVTQVNIAPPNREEQFDFENSIARLKAMQKAAHSGRSVEVERIEKAEH